jgi:thiol-disulfide isomerase/thioredoxin
VVCNLKSADSKENQEFFTYIKYITSRNKEFNKFREETKGKNKKDSTEYMNAKIKMLNDDVKKYEADFMTKMKGTFVYDVLNLKTEKEPTSIPKASNGRPDSLYSYYYYKGHYFDGVDFKDERIIRTPFFDDRIKRYFEQVVVNHPDTINAEIDKIMAKCNEGNLIYNLLLGYFTYKYEQSKIMGFDKVFVHVADKYILSGKAKGVYTEETITKIKERVDIMRNLLLDAQVSELYMIDTADGRKVRKMGFDTASSSKSITDLYYKNIEKLTPLFKTLYQVKAKYTVLVFWAVDCGHCQTEIPKLHEDLKALKGVDYKVFAVQTKDDLFDTWRKFLIEKDLKNFIHVYDPVHLNNLKERFDIYSTPVIYILDKDKKIKAKRLGAEQVVEMLKTLEAIDKANSQKN